MTPRDWGLSSAAAAMFVDQSTKFLLLYVFGFRAMLPGDSVPVLPFFNLVMTWNPGISYGLFPATGTLHDLKAALLKSRPSHHDPPWLGTVRIAG